MKQEPYSLDLSRREAILAALQERRSDRHWSLLAAHARPNHVHLVVYADVPPERIMNDVNSFASRCLNRLGLDKPFRKDGPATEARGCQRRRSYRQRFIMS